MAVAARSSLLSLTQKTLRSFSTTNHHNNHKESHQFMEANTFVASWKAPKDPKEAEKMLAQLRRDYANQVKDVRKEYIREMELLRIDKKRKDEARMLAVRAANEERNRLKAEAAKVRAQERLVAQEEFRQTLMKERKEKLENWRMKERLREEKKKEDKELLVRESSLWLEEKELVNKILAAIVDSQPL